MPNIFKGFLKPAVNQYVFQDVDEIEIEPDPPEVSEESAEAVDEPAEPATPEAEEESNAASFITFAKVQADEILADARRQADSLLEECRKRGEEEAQKAREEAHDEGYRQGYAEGLRKAEVEAEAKLTEQREQQTQQVQAFLEQASLAKDEMLQQTQQELLDLSVAIAEKVIHVSLKSSRSVIARMIQVATEKLKRREWVHIYVGGCAAKDLSQITPELVSALSGLSEHIKIIPMPEDESGTCVIEMPDSIIDASVSAQLQNIKGIISER